MRYVSPNFNERKAFPDMIILHYTGMLSTAEALERLCDKDSQVSAHYLIDEHGKLYALVDESKRAWHAGVSSWQKRGDVNSRSIGIEIANKGHEFGYSPFTTMQIDCVRRLCADVMNRWNIPFYNVLGHADVAPMRKQDPGELFDWVHLARAGIGLWTDDFCPLAGSVKENLETIGYDVVDEKAAMTAFCRHFYPDYFNGGEKAENRLAAVAQKFGREREKN